VLHTAARQNKPMNQGPLNLRLGGRTIAVATRADNHKARASFTVVAMANATAPYLAAAPPTELVS